MASLFTRRFGVLVGQAYGTTETGLVAADLLGGAGPDVLGRPVPGIRTRLRGGVLEVHVPQSPYVYGHERWPGGWMSTQDLVTRHPATGVLRRRGRIGEDTVPLDVDPLAIESVLRAHGQVKDAVVFASAPVEAHVAVAADVTDGALSAWCRRFLGPEATPRYFHVVRELPRTASGKLLRDRARLHGLGWSPRPTGRAERCR
ncbi:hypothetical protein [Streptomyces sp. NPDC047097]|uniref:AMP-binding enzyme n=1 Tax=Streptomyces sp. NPDC047097 TaxID=3155260 RepID=UPI0033D35FCE